MVGEAVDGVAVSVDVKPPYVLVRKLKVQYGEPGQTIEREAGTMPMSMTCKPGVKCGRRIGWEELRAELCDFAVAHDGTSAERARGLTACPVVTTATVASTIAATWLRVMVVTGKSAG